MRKQSKSENDGWDNGFQYFCFNDYKEESFHNISYFCNIFKIKLAYIVRKYMGDKAGVLLNKWGILSSVSPLNQYYTIKSGKKNYIIDGLFEYSYIVDEVIEQMRIECSSKGGRAEKNRFLYEVIENSESVCLSIRKFDLENKEYKERFQVCGLNYYYKALSYIIGKIPNVNIVVFFR